MLLETIGAFLRDDNLMLQNWRPCAFAGFDWGPALELDVDANCEAIVSRLLL